MILKKISILNYKNIQVADLTFSPKLNCLIGHNGEGKTNLLDAVCYLSFCRSAFNPIDSQVITHDRDFFVLDGLYLNDMGDEERIYCGMKRGTRKRFKRNQKEYKRLSQHIGLIPLIFVSPADTALIDGGSDSRRRFLDMVISQLDHSYIELLSRYNKALTQRNALLKAEQEPDGALMEILEQEMATQGEAIYAKRDAFVREFIPVFQTIYDHVSGCHETVSLQYISHAQRGPLLDVIQRDRHKDRAVGYSLHGVHRDDLEMMIGGYQLKREGSQGQNKTYVLALKLAQFDFLKRTASSTTPLLLLDDIFDKLDAGRVERIVNMVAGDAYGQIFITDTNRDHLDSILSRHSFDYKLFEVVHGEISERLTSGQNVAGSDALATKKETEGKDV
ncbi:DNA replication/repair protein RecF [Hoylesella buccalis]|uniref:DNA replication/repair protein RecF n=1 Tax=Hoylesella buccalis TaxID=28127 RepID=UPI00288A34D2|nr:DNA replication and repair protein RecF [Hoylesella buccalis]